jgi:hypothetical protein
VPSETPETGRDPLPDSEIEAKPVNTADVDDPHDLPTPTVDHDRQFVLDHLDVFVKLMPAMREAHEAKQAFQDFPSFSRRTEPLTQKEHAAKEDRLCDEWTTADNAITRIVLDISAALIGGAK